MVEASSRYVLVNIGCYPEALLDATLNTVLMERIESVLKQAPTERSMMRGVRALKDKALVPALLREALRRVSLMSGITEREALAAGGVVVARFPVPT